MRTISYETYLNKVYGCFIGKAVSGNIGAPHEGVKMPMELPFMPEMIDCSLPNDDLDLQVLWLDVLEKKGADFTPYDLLERFVSCCPYSPGEYAVMRKNYNRGIYPPYSGKFCNDYYIEGMGCPIRSEIWGCLAVGNPELASDFASRDGQLDHFGESIWAERFLAALESEAFFENDVRKLINKALPVLPEKSAFRELVTFTCELCDKYKDIKVVLTKLLFRYGHPDCTNMYQNMGITLAALLLGENDIIKTSLLALNCGFDTDCTCATAGAIIGLLRGAQELTEAYGLTEITYVLGVQSNRRSNKIFDLAEDIAKLAIEFSKKVNPEIRITGAPDVEFCFEAEPDYTFRADYENGIPSVSLGESTGVTLTVGNRTDKNCSLKCHIDAVNGLVCDLPDFTLVLNAHTQERVSLNVTLPIDTREIHDCNIFTFTALNEDGEEVLNKSFGIAAATPWKLCGPFWRTEPICTTELILEHFSERRPYYAAIPQSRIEGNGSDKLRHFHLNFATDTETEFIGEEALFEPLTADWSDRHYEQTLANVPEDSFRLNDFFGFQGPCVAYMSRILLSDDDKEVCIHIGHTCPFALYVNGELAAKRNYCDNWTAENVHLENVKLQKGENRITLRVTRINADAKLNVTFTKATQSTEHHTTLSSLNPYKW